MTAVRIAHADPWPGPRPDGRMSANHVLVVLADTVPTVDGGHRALPIQLRGRDGAFWRLLARPEDRGEVLPEDQVEEMTGQLLEAAGISVTAVTVTDLGPGVTAARIDVNTPGGARQVTTRLADGLSLAVITGAALAVDEPLMDRLAQPVTGSDLLSPFRSRQPARSGPPRRRRFEPRNLTFAGGLDGWQLAGTFMRQAIGLHEQDYSCTTEDGRAILTAAVPEPAGFAFLSQQVFADDYHGRAVVYRGELRATDVADLAGLMLRVDGGGRPAPPRPAPPRPAGDDPRDDPDNHFAFVTGTRDWTRYEVTAQIPPDANLIVLGVFLNGHGQVELRNPELQVD